MYIYIYYGNVEMVSELEEDQLINFVVVVVIRGGWMFFRSSPDFFWW